MNMDKHMLPATTLWKSVYSILSRTYTFHGSEQASTLSTMHTQVLQYTTYAVHDRERLPCTHESIAVPVR